MLVEASTPMLAKNIYFLRNQKKLSREKFSKLVGISGNMLFCIEHRLFYGIDERSLKNICNLFHVNEKSLLEEDMAIKAYERSNLMENTHYLYIFAKNIAYLRKRDALTQKQMAQIMGVGVGVIRKLEKGIPTPGMNCYAPVLLSQHFNISLDSLWRTELNT